MARITVEGDTKDYLVLPARLKDDKTAWYWLGTASGRSLGWFGMPGGEEEKQAEKRLGLR